MPVWIYLENLGLSGGVPEMADTESSVASPGPTQAEILKRRLLQLDPSRFDNELQAAWSDHTRRHDLFFGRRLRLDRNQGRPNQFHAGLLHSAVC
jgi:hypothetical protein